ncbi:DUF5983 family protein [Kosakonia sacchari]|uniref:DUF5983 family protein n=1 Tax=Kosakonia sacchari TaxID=1158459 RepID=UPI003F561143
MTLMTPALPLHCIFTGIQCSTAHITDHDNERFYQLSHDQSEYSDAEWIHFTGTGYLLRLNAWQHPVLRLKRLGMSKACRRLILALCHQYAITSIHFDAAGDVLPGVERFDW